MPSAATSSTVDGLRSSLSRLRAVTWSRVAFMVGLLALGLVLVNVLGGGKPRVTNVLVDSNTGKVAQVMHVT